MPTISMFQGILIRMNVRGEHNPPHIHAEYQKDEAVFDFDGNILEGDLPTRQTRLVVAWIELHKEELQANWKLAMNKEPLYKIDPLK